MKHLKAYSTVASFIRVALICLAGWCLIPRALAESVTLAWDPSPDPVQRYVVHYGTASRAYGSTTNAGPALTLTVQGLVQGQTYFFAVTAIGTNSLESDFSNEVSYSVPNPNNTAPTITAISNQTINEDGTAGPLSFTVGDAETAASSLTATGASSNTGLVPNGNISFGGSGANRTVTFTPAANQSGSAQITLTVSDGLLTDSRTFTVSVNAVNDAPTIAAIANQTTSVGNAVGPIAFAVGDVETSASSLALAGTSSSTGLIPNANINFGGSGANRTVTITPAAGQTGTAQITVTVSDGSLTANRSFTVAVVDAQTLGLVAAYSFDEGNGTSFGDASGNNNTGSTGGSSWTASGRHGGALSFSGNSLAVVNDAASLDLASAMTLEVWVYPTASATDWSTVLMKETSGGLVYALYAANDTGAPEGLILTSSEQGAAGSGSLPLNTWSHLAATYDGSTLRLFVNGTQTGSRSLSGSIATSSGTLSLGGNSVWNEYFAGRIDEVRVYNRALSAAEIQVDMNTPIGTPPANTSPTITTIANQTINEDGAAGPLSFTISDAETAAGNLTLTRSSSNTSLVSTANVVLGGAGANRMVTVTPAANQSGTAQITVTVSDGSLTTSGTFEVIVNAINDVPTLATIGNVTAAAGAGLQTVNLSGIGTGAANETQTLTVSATSGNTAVVPSPSVTYTSPNSTGTLLFTPQIPGAAQITVTVQDNGGTANGGVNTVQRTFTVNVTSPTNSSAPTITTIASQNLNEDGVAGPLSFTVGDAQTAAGSLTVTGSSGNIGLVPDANIVLGGTGANRTVTVRPATNQFGTAQITLTVSDGSLTGSSTFTLTVNSVNDRPTVNPPANIAVTPVPQAQGLGLAALGAGATVWDIGASYLVEEQVVTVTGIGIGADSSQLLTVTASSSNPALVPHPVVTYSSPSSSASLRVKPSSAPGSAQITITVRDNGGTANGGVDTATAVFTFTIDAPANTPPTLAAIADRTTNEDAVLGPVSLSVNDGQTAAGALTVTAASQNTAVIANAGLQLAGSGGSRSLTVQPVSNRYGKSLVTIQVADDQGASTSRAFWLNVLPVNDAPLLNAIANVLLDGQTPQEMVTLTGISAGPFEAPQTLSVQASSSNPALIPHPEVAYRSADSAAELQLLPVAGSSGTATITVTVRDDGGTAYGGVNTLTRTFTVSGSAPLAAAPLPEQIVEGTVAALMSLPLPRLQIAIDEGMAILTWDAATGPAALQRSRTLGVSAAWTAVEMPVAQQDGQNRVCVALKSGTEFFRLVRP